MLSSLRSHWHLAPGVTYLNHGSFGLSPQSVKAERRRWLELVEADPMDFFVRQQEPELAKMRAKLGELLGATAADLALVENATVAMNAVAASVKLQPGDEVLLDDHEYGAVKRIWQRACERSGAVLREVELPFRRNPQSKSSRRSSPVSLLAQNSLSSVISLRLPRSFCRRRKLRGPFALAAWQFVSTARMRSLKCRST